MARISRVVAAGYPHHVTQRGNRRQQTFFCDDDYRTYITLMSDWCKRRRVAVWAYCLMPNHVHLIAVPKSAAGLSRAIAEAHRRYTRMINFREDWRGYLWQGRFSSFVMDREYLLAAARYIEMNPVRAGIVQSPEQWRWSSAPAHLSGKDDGLVAAAPLLKMAHKNWKRFLVQPADDAALSLIRKCEKTGRPLGSERFILRLEKKLKRRLRPQKPGPKAKNSSN